MYLSTKTYLQITKASAKINENANAHLANALSGYLASCTVAKIKDNPPMKRRIKLVKSTLSFGAIAKGEYTYFKKYFSTYPHTCMAVAFVEANRFKHISIADATTISITTDVNTHDAAPKPFLSLMGTGL